MNTNSVNNNANYEDRYEYYTCINECNPDVQFSTQKENIHSQNAKEISKAAVGLSNDYLSNCQKTESVLDKAKCIEKKTTQFKNDYYQDALKKKGQDASKPNIKNYIEVARELKNKGEEIDDSIILANSTDCSGFIKMIYAESGKDLLPLINEEEKKMAEIYGPKSSEFIKRDRGAELLRRAATPVSLNEVKPGDLVFFKEIEDNQGKSGNKSGIKLTDYATHIGMVSRKEKDKDGNEVIYFIHKSTNGGVVESTLNSRARVNQKINYKDLDPTFGRIE